MIFERFDEVRIINLAHREDRRREMAAEIERLGATIDGKHIAFFDAIKVNDKNGFYSAGAHGCYLSHMTLLEQAKGSILILEDDCDFTDLAATYQVPDCDIFYGGYYKSEKGEIFGCHMMGYFSPNHVGTYLKTVLNDPEFRNNVPPPPADAAIIWYRRAYPEARTVFADLAIQRPSRTDVAAPHWIDRVPAIGSAPRKLRKLLAA